MGGASAISNHFALTTGDLNQHSKKFSFNFEQDASD